MASSEEIHRLRRHGEIGLLLMREFNGEMVGHHPLCKDRETLIKFESERATPEAHLVGLAVFKYMRRIGYYVTDLRPFDQYLFLAYIESPDEADVRIYMTITTKFPVDGISNFLRLSTMDMMSPFE